MRILTRVVRLRHVTEVTNSLRCPNAHVDRGVLLHELDQTRSGRLEVGACLIRVGQELQQETREQRRGRPHKREARLVVCDAGHQQVVRPVREVLHEHAREVVGKVLELRRRLHLQVVQLEQAPHRVRRLLRRRFHGDEGHDSVQARLGRPPHSLVVVVHVAQQPRQVRVHVRVESAALDDLRHRQVAEHAEQRAGRGTDAGVRVVDRALRLQADVDGDGGHLVLAAHAQHQRLERAHRGQHHLRVRVAAAAHQGADHGRHVQLDAVVRVLGEVQERARRLQLDHELFVLPRAAQQRVDDTLEQLLVVQAVEEQLTEDDEGGPALRVVHLADVLHDEVEQLLHDGRRSGGRQHHRRGERVEAVVGERQQLRLVARVLVALLVALVHDAQQQHRRARREPVAHEVALPELRHAALVRPREHDADQALHRRHDERRRRHVRRRLRGRVALRLLRLRRRLLALRVLRVAGRVVERRRVRRLVRRRQHEQQRT
eukprot:Rhum_TRINITY_DN14795_c12_g1::Rhum_TRINITY_DN14795_c12_g1_i1::g.118302::m.118302